MMCHLCGQAVCNVLTVEQSPADFLERRDRFDVCAECCKRALASTTLRPGMYAKETALPPWTCWACEGAFHSKPDEVASYISSHRVCGPCFERWTPRAGMFKPPSGDESCWTCGLPLFSQRKRIRELEAENAMLMRSAEIVRKGLRDLRESLEASR